MYIFRFDAFLFDTDCNINWNIYKCKNKTLRIKNSSLLSLKRCKIIDDNYNDVKISGYITILKHRIYFDEVTTKRYFII